MTGLRHHCCAAASRTLLFACALFALPVRAAPPEPLPELLARVAATYGAAPPAALRETGRTISFRRGEAPLVRLYRAPDRFRIDIAYAGGSERRGLVGERAWAQEQAANPMLRAAIVLQAARMALPWNLLAAGPAARDRGGVRDANGRDLREVEWDLAGDLKLIVEIDPESALIRRSRGILAASGNTLEFATVYEDFRRFDGRLRATREQHFAMGQAIGHSVIETVDFPASLADSAFAP